MKRSPKFARTAGFTLLELLVVVAVIAILAGILLSVINGVQERARDAKCAANLRQLGAACLLFASEHNGQLPGTFDTRDKNLTDESLAYQGSWLTGATGETNESRNGPEKGTIFQYAGKDPRVYRCPSQPVSAKVGDGRGSNGKFDYAFFCRLGGARIPNVPAKARLREKLYALPMIIEENPAAYINSDKYNIEGTHGFADEASTVHRKGCNYVSIDGSVNRLVLTAAEGGAPKGEEWLAVLAPDSVLNLGKPNLGAYGDWAVNGTFGL